jgi:hypothetical protein
MKHCIDCEAYTFRDHPAIHEAKNVALGNEMAKKHKLGRCIHGPGHRFTSPTKTLACTQFAQADANTVAQRRAFVSKS